MDLTQVKRTVCDVLEVSPSLLASDTVLEDIESYDSLKALSLMVALDEIGVSLTQNDIANLRTYGDIEAFALSRSPGAK